MAQWHDGTGNGTGTTDGTDVWWLVGRLVVVLQIGRLLLLLLLSSVVVVVVVVVHA